MRALFLRKDRRHVWFCSLIALVFTGCAVGPNYQRPVTPTPSQFAHSASLTVTNDTVPSAWWETFHDPLLNQLIARASTNNLDLRRAEARLREARALWREARFDYVPTVRASAGYEDVQISRAVAAARDRHAELYRAGFDATWELDLWGAVRRNVEAARATVEAVEAGRDDVLVALQGEVVLNYLELRGSQARLDVGTRNATNQEQTLNLTIALRDGGQGTQLDVARARSLLNQTLASIPPVEVAINGAMHRVAVLCGLVPTALTNELAVHAALPNVPTELVIKSPDELLRGRPDVRTAERSLAAATARVGVETADLFPRVTLNGTLGLEASQISGLTAAGADTHSFGPHITWAALDIGRVRQRIKAAGARADQALAAYEQTVLLVLEEVENSFVALSRERLRLAYLTEAERAASEAVSLARQRYRDGFADYLGVLDSERTLLELQDQLVTAQTLSATRLVAVYKAFATGKSSGEQGK